MFVSTIWPGGLYIELSVRSYLLTEISKVVASTCCNVGRRISECFVTFLTTMAVPSPSVSSLSFCIRNSLGSLISQKVANEIQLLEPIKYRLLTNR